ncbi:hypothetical protein [Azospirillum canadense]|uniref:hypothetical protein n=1 Tax=Azospirillum canadense TaxID=403962 RepID=UPI0022268D02|nr:hypothetical protein [Azospirillum canadense]MCW2237667.1 hypothetical protein [Azospirillum canadense]
MADTKRTAFFTLLSHALDEALPFVAVATLRADSLASLQSAFALTVAFDSRSLDPIPLAPIAALVRRRTIAGYEIPAMVRKGRVAAIPANDMPARTTFIASLLT